MLDIAYAYSQAGKREQFDDAMKRVGAAIEARASFGVSSWFNSFDEANYWLQAGDRELAISKLNVAAEGGFSFGVRISRVAAVFKQLEGDPEYEAIQSNMMDSINYQRAKLNLEPLSI